MRASGADRTSARLHAAYGINAPACNVVEAYVQLRQGAISPPAERACLDGLPSRAGRVREPLALGVRSVAGSGLRSSGLRKNVSVASRKTSQTQTQAGRLHALPVSATHRLRPRFASLRSSEMRSDALKPVPNPIPSSHPVTETDNADTAETAYVQPFPERSDVGVEPTYRWATPVLPVLKVCYVRSI
jgi:hypothetical protein